MEKHLDSDVAHPENLNSPRSENLNPTHLENLNLLHTEQSNPLTADLDTLGTLDMVRRMNTLDLEVPRQIGRAHV